MDEDQQCREEDHEGEQECEEGKEEWETRGGCRRRVSKEIRRQCWNSGQYAVQVELSTCLRQSPLLPAHR